MKILAQWYPREAFGKAVGSMSLSYMLGDALVRLILGSMLALDLEWREVIWVSSGIAIGITLPAFFTLRESPLDVGLPPVVDARDEKKPLLSDDEQVDALDSEHATRGGINYEPSDMSTAPAAHEEDMCAPPFLAFWRSTHS